MDCTSHDLFETSLCSGNEVYLEMVRVFDQYSRTLSKTDSHGWPGPFFRKDYKDKVWSINHCSTSLVHYFCPCMSICTMDQFASVVVCFSAFSYVIVCIWKLKRKAETENMCIRPQGVIVCCIHFYYNHFFFKSDSRLALSFIPSTLCSSHWW